jgi:hypothetical protein
MSSTGEHDAQVARSVHRGVSVIGDGRRREKPGELKRPWPSGVRIMAISTR